MAKKYIYEATVYRFGSDLTVLETTEKKAVEALKEAYIKAFRKYNNDADPAEEETRYGTTYLEEAMSDIQITRYELGKVEWR